MYSTWFHIFGLTNCSELSEITSKRKISTHIEAISADCYKSESIKLFDRVQQVDKMFDQSSETVNRQINKLINPI